MAWQGQPQYPSDPNQQQYYGQSPYPPPNQGFPQPGFNQQPGFQPNYPPPGAQPGFQQPYNPAYPHQMPYQPPYVDPEDPEAKNFEFTDESIRKGFIKKVYSILTLQLSVTIAIICLFIFHEPTNKFVRAHSYLQWVALGILLVTMIVLICCESVRRSSPMNVICLGVFTLAQSFVMGCLSIRYAADTVLMAAGITAAVTLALTIFAFQTKWDFTVMGGVLFVAVIILFVFGLIAMFFPGRTIQLVYASFGALLFCIFLVYDTQMMMGGNHKYSISPEEYVFAALNLYLDIVQIFMYVLQILGAIRSD